MKSYSIRWKIIIPTLIMLIVGFLGIQLFFINTVERLQTETIQNFLTTQIENYNSTLESQWSTSADNPHLQNQIEDWADQIDARITLISPVGTILADSSNIFQSNIQTNVAEFQEIVNTGQTIVSEVDYFSNSPTLYLSTPIYVENDIKAIIRIIYPLHEIEHSISVIRNSIWISAIIVITLAALPIIYQTKLQGNRLEIILQAIRQISAGNRSVRLDIDTQDEIGGLAEEINFLTNSLCEEFQLMQSEQAKLNAVLTQMNDGVIILDNNGIIILANQAVQNIFNFTTLSIEGLRFVRAIPNHHIVELWKEFQDTNEDQASFLELPESNKSIQIYLTPLGPNLPGYSLFYFQDLTRMRQLEIVRRDFISNISHELRTPLASLKALSDTLQVSIPDDPEASERFLKRMDTEIDALTQMVSELLELSRIEAGQVSIEIAPTDANKILSQACERLAIQAERAKIDIIVKPHNSPAIIMVDGSRIEQILVNIIHNAIKFTPPDGKIKCAVKIKGNDVIFSIKDNGQGISAEDLPRIFERFYKSKKQNHKAGTGLGLSIAKHLTEANGGHIWAESKYGEGATFYLAFHQNGSENA